MDDLIKRQDAIDAVKNWIKSEEFRWSNATYYMEKRINNLSSAQQNYDPEMKREFIRMAEYIDCLLQCSDEQKETLIGFISRLAEYMPWTERD